jgi:orotate phosphoribosyltransferase-like protein
MRDINKQMNPFELLNQVKELVDQGFGRVVIARKLNISDGKATRLIRKVKGENLVIDPGVVAQVTDMLEKGFSHYRIESQLSDILTRLELESVMEKIREDNPDLLEPLQMTSRDKFQLVKELLEQQYTNTQIAGHLNCSRQSAEYWINKVKMNFTRPSSIDTVRDMLDSESDGYDVAKRFNKSVQGASSMIKKAECLFSPIDEWVKKVSVNGVKLSRLKQNLPGITQDKASQIIKDNFPNCFVITRELADGDVVFTPVHDSKKRS